MDFEVLFFWLKEFMYALTGLIALIAGVRGLKNEDKKYGTFVFWTITGLLFILGAHIPPQITGGLICVLALITLTKQISVGQFTEVPAEFKVAMARKYGNKIFIPALMIGVLSFVFLQFSFGEVKVPSAVALGFASIIAIITAFVFFKPDVKEITEDSSKMVMQVGPASLLPQLLTGLGAIFTAAGIGEMISNGLSNVIPESNMFVAVAIYCIGMAVFTMIMGNGFAAFSVITTGIAAPFLLAHGANPAVVGAMGMTAGFCGTLMTPMAANFNIVSASIMEMKDTNGVIKAQVWLAIPLLVIHIILMYVLAFSS